jgi:large subunit ribosomal protein L4
MRGLARTRPSRAAKYAAAARSRGDRRAPVARVIKAGAGQIVVLDGLSMQETKTKLAAAMIKALGLNDQNVLLVVAEKEANVVRSVTNLPQVKLVLSGYLNVRDLLGYDVLLMAKDAVARVETWLGSEVAQDDAGVVAEVEA